MEYYCVDCGEEWPYILSRPLLRKRGYVCGHCETDKDAEDRSDYAEFYGYDDDDDDDDEGGEEN